ncbi:MAG: hypothetical protein FWG02_02350 [Holophagaceae bacterium]|nr:hypothetical protein [Holophagaceae bacterium]
MPEEQHVKYIYSMIILAIVVIVGLTVVDSMGIAKIPKDVIKTISIVLFVMVGAFLISFFKKLFSKNHY